ncbi:uncharacterized protein LOC124134407 [Haliotis rufescens]|uniref:uncharacterized protein LOC124134407 n=1 Tax=Haliotis rufescens TaxID=6454 RepID=UPI00201F7D2F|nr:uncharacterized protein LOC124134407 [Haliotis rufescens]
MTKRQDINSGRKLRGDARDRQSSQRRDGVVRGQNFTLDIDGDISNAQCGNSNIIVHVKNITVMPRRVKTRRTKPRSRSRKAVRQRTRKYGVGTKITRPTKSVRSQFKDIDIKEYLKIGLSIEVMIIMIVNMLMKD